MNRSDETNGGAAIALAREFLAAIEAEDEARAAALLAPGAVMIFPGARRFDAISTVLAGLRRRYRSVRKRFDRFDVVAGDPVVVYCTGTLHGAFADGTAFADIRFVDRFEIAGGLIARQDVWNDVGALHPGR